tara:strand:+ start:534 stop:767 length:234 start_codon:yes stop_codon:yes gene_type:complete
LENLKRKNNLIDTKALNLPFKEIMELVNANNGFYYSKDSKKKLNRYTGKVSRRFVRGSTGKPQKSGGISRLLRTFIS